MKMNKHTKNILWDYYVGGDNKRDGIVGVAKDREIRRKKQKKKSLKCPQYRSFSIILNFNLHSDRYPNYTTSSYPIIWKMKVLQSFSSRGVNDLRDAVLDYLGRIDGGTFFSFYRNLCCHRDIATMEMKLMQIIQRKWRFWSQNYVHCCCCLWISCILDLWGWNVIWIEVNERTEILCIVYCSKSSCCGDFGTMLF